MITFSQFWPILAAAAAAFLFGGFWYSKTLFAKTWNESVGRTEEDMLNMSKEQKRTMTYGFLATVALSYALSSVLSFIEPETLTQSLQIAILICFGFVITIKFSDMIFASRDPHWSRKPQMLFLIDSGYYLIAFSIITAVLWWLR